MGKRILLLMSLVSWPVAAYGQAQLNALRDGADRALSQAAEAARKAGLRDVMTYPKQSFVVSWKGVRLGAFLSLGARRPGASYQCVQSFVPDDATMAVSMVITAGAGKLGTDICDHPRAVGVLHGPDGLIRIGILYANSDYVGGAQDAGAEAPPVSAAVVLDEETRRMTLDAGATEILQKAAPESLPAMRALF